MHIYRLTNPKDKNGQPLRIFRAAQRNNEAKAIDQLSGICAGILADGIVNESEAEFFADWVRVHAGMEPVWPFNDILVRVERIFADGKSTAEERNELKILMEALCGHTASLDTQETCSTALPFDEPLPTPIIFPQRLFNITGKFAFGTRRNVIKVIEEQGGSAVDSTPTHESHYLLVGVFASRDWAHSNFGRKIERALELRKGGSGLAIISEEHWKKFLC